MSWLKKSKPKPPKPSPGTWTAPCGCVFINGNPVDACETCMARLRRKN